MVATGVLLGDGFSGRIQASLPGSSAQRSPASLPGRPGLIWVGPSREIPAQHRPAPSAQSSSGCVWADSCCPRAPPWPEVGPLTLTPAPFLSLRICLCQRRKQEAGFTELSGRARCVHLVCGRLSGARLCHRSVHPRRDWGPWWEGRWGGAGALQPPDEAPTTARYRDSGRLLGQRVLPRAPVCGPLATQPGGRPHQSGLWGTRVTLGPGERRGPRVSAAVSVSSRACSWRDHRALKAPR